MTRLGLATWLFATVAGCSGSGAGDPMQNPSAVSFTSFVAAVQYDDSQQPTSLDISFALKNDDTRALGGLSKIEATPFGDWKVACLKSPWMVAAGAQSAVLQLGGTSNGGAIHDQFYVGVPCQGESSTDQISEWIQGTISKGQSFQFKLTGIFADGQSFTASTAGTY